MSKFPSVRDISTDLFRSLNQVGTNQNDDVDAPNWNYDLITETENQNPMEGLA